MREALAFLTPLGGARRPTPRALRYFPVVGALLGLALGGVWWLAAKVWPATIAAVVVVVADLALTGMLHMDGLADSADGLLPHLSRPRRLEVMGAPDVGAFGVTVVAAVLLARFAALVVIRPAPLLLGALYCTSRTAMAATVDRLRYARSKGGLASAFQGSRVPVALVGVAIAVSAAAAAVWARAAGPVAVAAAAVAFAGVIALGVRRVGGYTGDVLGAAGVIGETVGLVVAAGKW
jgi:adenosylcobinamide-GDP ribazoletransferase